MYVKEVETSLVELFGEDAKDLFGREIKYIIFGENYLTDLTIMDLTKITASCKYNFDLTKINDEHSFEFEFVKLKPQIVYSSINEDEFTKYIQENQKSKYIEYLYKDKYFSFSKLLKLLKTNKEAITNNNGIINYSNIYPSLIKSEYKFKKDKYTNVIYCEESNLLVDIDDNTDMSIFSDLEYLDLNKVLITRNIRKITVDQYKVIKYCIDNLKGAL